MWGADDYRPRSTHTANSGARGCARARGYADIGYTTLVMKFALRDRMVERKRTHRRRRRAERNHRIVDLRARECHRVESIFDVHNGGKQCVEGMESGLTLRDAVIRDAGFVRSDPYHDRRHEVTKDVLSKNPGEDQGERLAARLDEVYNNRAVARPNTPGGTSTTPEKAVGSQIAPTLFGPCPP